MKRTNFLTSLVLAISLLAGQAGIAFAAPALQKSGLIVGTVRSLTLETDPNTGVTTLTVEVTRPDGSLQTVRLSQGTAVAMGLVSLNGDGNLVLNNLALGQPIEIDPAVVIPDQQKDPHPIGNALATFFSDIVNYDTIMEAHDDGVGFGVIAQALWMTKELHGDADLFKALLHARETGDYSAFALEDGTVPQSWGQLRKAIMEGKKLHDVKRDKNSGSAPQKEKDKGQDNKKDNGSKNSNNGKDKGQNK